MRDSIECYKILGLEPGAAAERVKKSYLELIAVWDPDKHLKNPVLRAQAEKRVEIEEAYKAIRHFLPELQDDFNPKRSANQQDRDFREMERETPSEASKALVALAIVGVLSLVFAFGYHIYKQTRVIPKETAPLVDPEAAAVIASSTTTPAAP